MSSVVGYARKKGNSLHRGDNPAMKNKRSARMRTDAVRKTPVQGLNLLPRAKNCTAGQADPHAGRLSFSA